nr:MAG TPA: hypothetical protein [Caudoviricetes sp.]
MLCYRVPLLSTAHFLSARAVQFSSYFYGVVIRRIYIPTPPWHGAAKQNEFGFLIPYALFLKPCPSPTFITRRISQQNGKSGFRSRLFCSSGRRFH